MKLEQEISTAVSDTIRGLKNAVTNCKLDGQIADEEKNIAALTREIGTLTVHKLDDGAEMAPEIMERYAAIQTARSSIKNSSAEKKADKAVCPKCGTKTMAGMRFCGSCGALMNA